MQQEFFGYGSIEKLKDILNKYDPKNIFLISGKKSFKLSGAEEKILSIIKNYNYTHFNSFSSNPNLEDIKQGISLFKQNSHDLTITVGGGSAIDIGKTINALAFQKNDPELYVQNKKSLKIKGMPLIAIPITSGTGSESTHFATIYINKIKYSLSSEEIILPTIAIIDPSLTESMPKYLTAVTGLDALCQGIESIWAIKSTKESIKYGKEAVKLAYNTIEKAVKNPDKNSRIKMAKAANLSGKAINISKTTASHSISYPITSHFNVAHGQAVAITMPEMIQYNYDTSEKDCNDPRGIDFVKKRLSEIIRLTNSSNQIEAKKNFKNLMKKIDIETKLNRLNIDEKGIELILKEGFTPNRMNNNPRKMKRENLEKILRKIL